MSPASAVPSVPCPLPEAEGRAPSVDSLCPRGPAAVPDDLTRPSATYERRAWIAVAALLTFVVLYLSLTGWFAYEAYRMFRDAWDGWGQTAVGYVGSVLAAFYALFLAKALFFVKRGRSEGLTEVTAEQQPRLFAFLDHLAREAGAPRPHHVFLSPGVNAAVFYDLSLLNLLLPSKKNLEIGLGLVHALSLSEFKAVLAHELGHFAQRTMAVGRWVYISHQVAAHIVGRRDAFDSLLLALSRIDLRVAWIGWAMRLVVWSIRAIVDSAFRVVVLAERALSRQMELQADLVAVSLSGSDALIHALHKLSAADDASEQALRRVLGGGAHDRPDPDLFAVQARILERTRAVLGDETHGQAPPLPEVDRAAHRVFQTELALPPRMWASHPPNREREDNAKRRYLDAPLDDRSAWELFVEPEALRARVTAGLLELAARKEQGDASRPEPMPLAESLAAIDKEFSASYLDRRYRGAYLGRSPVRHVQTVAELYGEAPGGPDAVRAALDALYPESLGDDLRRLRELEQEHAALTALQDGLLAAPGGIIRHRGSVIPRRQLAGVVAAVEEERRHARQRLQEHDRACRTAHRAAAALLGPGWEAYLASLAALLHYAAHCEAELRDAARHLGNVVSIVTADGRVSSGELVRVISSGTALHERICEIHAHRQQVVLPPEVAGKLEAATWQAALPAEQKLPAPGRQNIGDWLQVIDGWLGSFRGPLVSLRNAALDTLLVTEAHVARCLREQVDPGAAPVPAAVPVSYPTLLLGQERQLQRKLGAWDRFVLADGLVPGLARFVVAATIVGAVFVVAPTVGVSTATIWNGLDRRVEVTIGGRSRVLLPSSRGEVELPHGRHVLVRTRTGDGLEVESFLAETKGRFARYAYNVAAASPLVEWTVSYGHGGAPSERTLGAIRWLQTHADVLFEEPPRSVSTSGGGATRLVLSGFGWEPVSSQLALLEDEGERHRVALEHARWDDPGSPRFLAWVGGVFSVAAFAPVLQQRLAEKPENVVLLRLEQDLAGGPTHATVCARHAALAKARPESSGLRYLTLRCLADDAARDEAFLRESEAAPDDPWLAMAAGYAWAKRGNWQEALSRFARARASIPVMAEQLALVEARVRRVVAAEATPPTPAVLDDLVPSSPLLRKLVALETGKDVPEGPLQAFASLQAGELAQALETSRSDEHLHARTLRLVAASEGATPEQVAQALKLTPEQGLDRSTRWSALALARREGADTAPYSRRLADAHEPEQADMAVFADAAEVRRDPAAAEARLATLDPELRGQACTMAVIVLGAEAPARWRTQARALLFSFERPHLR